MPNLEVTIQSEGRTGRPLYDAVREELETQKAEHPEWSFDREPEFRDGGGQITAIQPYKIASGYVAPAPEPEVEEVAVEATTCERRKLLGGICGRDLPCRYHK